MTTVGASALMTKEVNVSYIVWMSNHVINYYARITDDPITHNSNDPIIKEKAEEVINQIFVSLNKVQLTEEQKSKIRDTNSSFIASMLKSEICSQVIMQSFTPLTDGETLFIRQALERKIYKMLKSTESKFYFSDLVKFVEALFKFDDQSADTIEAVKNFNNNVKAISSSQIKLNQEKLNDLIKTISAQVEYLIFTNVQK